MTLEKKKRLKVLNMDLMDSLNHYQGTSHPRSKHQTTEEEKKKQKITHFKSENPSTLSNLFDTEVP